MAKYPELIGQSSIYGKRTDCGCKTIRFYDLTGKRFGSLVAETKEPPTGDGKTRWKCRCDCGNTYVTTSYALRKGKAKSCGCGRRKNITGLRFGKLTALERTEQYVMQSNKKKFLWKCVCDCGERRFH